MAERGIDVGVIMGSDSDLPIMQHAGKILDRFGVPFEERVISAHRTDERMFEYSREAEERGIKVIIAGAGGSAHLPGMTASGTILPVVGVAIESKPDSTNAALGSMVRMPKGKPLGTMGKNEAAAANAGLFAVRILALGNRVLAEAYRDFDTEMAEEVIDKDAALMEMGAAAYLAQVNNAT